MEIKKVHVECGGTVKIKKYSYYHTNICKKCQASANDTLGLLEDNEIELLTIKQLKQKYNLGD